MKRSTDWLAVAVALAVAGCSSATTAPTATSPATTAAPPAGASPKAPAATASGQTVTDLNDKAFRLLDERKWADAAAASREALAQDQASSAAWFNLGKAQVGMGAHSEAVKSFQRASQMTAGKNGDVEYNLARALWLAGDAPGALSVIETGIKQFPDDSDFTALRDQVRGVHAVTRVDERTWQTDFDGDGKPDTFRMRGNSGAAAGTDPDGLRLVVTAADGHVLYEGALLGKVYGIKLLQMPDGTRIAHIEVEGCPSYPQNQFLAYDEATRQVTDPWEKGDICAAWSYAGNGKFTTFYRVYYPVAVKTERVWERGKFTGGKSTMVIYDGVDATRLPALLSDLAGRSMEAQGTEHLFAAPALFEQFRARTAAGHWHFEQSGPVQGDTLKLTVKVDDKAYGVATLTLKKQDDRRVVITELIWPK